MRITSKGQVTIPAHIRRKAGLLPNTEVEFIYEDGTVRIVRAKGPRKQKSRGEMAVELLSGTGTIKMTTDEILRLMRGD